MCLQRAATCLHSCWNSIVSRVTTAVHCRWRRGQCQRCGDTAPHISQMQKQQRTPVVPDPLSNLPQQPLEKVTQILSRKSVPSTGTAEHAFGALTYDSYQEVGPARDKRTSQAPPDILVSSSFSLKIVIVKTHLRTLKEGRL